MRTPSTHEQEHSTKSGTLYLALELGQSKWQLAFTTQAGQKPRLRTIKARDRKSLEGRSVAPSSGSAFPSGRGWSVATKRGERGSGSTGTWSLGGGEPGGGFLEH